MRHKNTPTQRILNSLVFIEKDDETLSIDFKDKGLKIEITEEYAIISTTFHKHVFDAVGADGYSETYIMLKHFVEIVLSLNLRDKDEEGVEYFSYKKLCDYMAGEDVDKEDLIIFQFCDMWMFNIYQPLNTLQSNAISSFIVFINYISNLANTSILLKENKEDITNKKYIESYIKIIKELTKDIEERVVINGISDEEIISKVTDEKKEK